MQHRLAQHQRIAILSSKEPNNLIVIRHSSNNQIQRKLQDHYRAGKNSQLKPMFKVRSCCFRNPYSKHNVYSWHINRCNIWKTHLRIEDGSELIDSSLSNLLLKNDQRTTTQQARSLWRTMDHLYSMTIRPSSSSLKLRRLRRRNPHFETRKRCKIRRRTFSSSG